MNELIQSVWTRFFDMSSGGNEKLEFCTLWIEAPKDRAVEIFKTLFSRDPNNVTCNCCGPDYSFYEMSPDYIAEGDWILHAKDIEAALARE